MKRHITIFFSAVTAAAPALLAQPCEPEWAAQPIGDPGIVGVVNHLLVWDDGTGPAIYASGHFTFAGITPVASVAKWDGLQWSNLGEGLTRSGRATRVPGLAIHDDGSGEALYATGSFDTAGTIDADVVAKWDGSSWSAVGTGLSGQGFKMAVYNDGHGDKLYLGGVFSGSGSISNLARWTGEVWEDIGIAQGSVNTLITHDDGSGPALFLGGNMTNVGGTSVSGIAKYQNGSWTSLSSGVTGGTYTGRVNSIVPFDDGTGERLFVGGDFAFAGPIEALNIASWDGNRWDEISAGAPDAQISVMSTYDDGSGIGLYIGGKFQTVGSTAALSVARYDGSAWSTLAEGLDSTGIISVTAMTTFNQPGFGNALVVGGGFEVAGTLPTENIALWGGCDACYADCDQSTGAGVLDIFDFLCFQSSFVAGDPYACDCDLTTGGCDIFDFLCFQDAFVAGCP